MPSGPTCATRCPVAHTERYHGAWLPVTHADVSQIAHDTENYTSQAVLVSNGESFAEAPIGGAPPITSDPPFHHHARRLLLPAVLSEEDRAVGAGGRAGCATSCSTRSRRRSPTVPASSTRRAAYTQNIPVNVIARMLGFPVEDADLFRGFVHETLEQVDAPIEERIAAFERLDAYLDVQVQDHIANPRDDLTSYLLERDDLRPAAQPGARARLDRAAVARRDRHDVERDRLQRCGTSPATPTTSPASAPSRFAVAHGDRGVPARLRAGDDGPARGQGPRAATAVR